MLSHSHTLLSDRDTKVLISTVFKKEEIKQYMYGGNKKISGFRF